MWWVGEQIGCRRAVEAVGGLDQHNTGPAAPVGLEERYLHVGFKS